VRSDSRKNLQELLLCQVVPEGRDVLERVGLEHGLVVEVVDLQVGVYCRTEEVDWVDQVARFRCTL
jgi:hypothetical protein